MITLLWLAIIALALDACLILAFIGSRIATPSQVTWPSELTPLLVLAGVLTALITFLTNLQRNRSEDVLEAATDLFEKAHQSLLTKEGELNNYRLSWLSSARLVATAEQLSPALTEDSHKLIYKTKREYWRTRLYELLHQAMPEGPEESFFAEEPEHMIGHMDGVRPPLSEKSVAYLYRFARWPSHVIDPIASEPKFTDKEIEQMQMFGPRALGRLLSRVRQIVPLPPPPK